MKRRLLRLVPLSLMLFLLTSCATWDFGMIKIPAVLGYLAIGFFVIYMIVQHYTKK
jgi:Kef-type K+ transport system membrane component KefB